MHQFTFDADKDRAHVKAREHFLIGPRNAGSPQWTGTSDDSAKQITCLTKIFQSPLVGVID